MRTLREIVSYTPQGHFGGNLDRISIRFVKLRVTGPVPTETYKSSDRGGGGGDAAIDVGEYNPIIGIYGVVDQQPHRIGLITRD